MSNSELLLVDREKEYAVITINRPEKRNAVSRPLQLRLREILDELREEDVRVIVLTGAGDVSFCAGVDLKDDSPEIRTTALEPNPWLATQRRIAEHPAIFISAVNGYALGGGLTLVNNAELAIASETATFGAPEITFGVYAALAGPSSIRRVLPKHAADLVLTGRRIDAETALRWGMVNEVVAPEELLPRAEELAARISSFDRTVLDVAKNALRAEHLMDWDAALDHGSRTAAFTEALRKANS
ncbi:enoyl-CoA hydratase/isomerase family protein [Streptomyces sp. NPDC046805]|uniref:enoyl-CoA hydratase/isomerase family protein n=1 Tax=Streptomyces sp. NPDC046805 TaxID=3155134 RepID=UPI0033D70769